MPRRVPLRLLPLHKRYSGLCARERILQRKYLLAAAVCLLVYTRRRRDGREDARKAKRVAAMVLLQREALLRAFEVERFVYPRVTKLFDSYGEAECWQKFRMRKHDLPRLLSALGLENRDIVTAQGSRYNPETALLFLLARMAYPGRLQKLSEEFGRDATQLSRLFNKVVDLVYARFRDTLMDGIGAWLPHFAHFAAKIAAKTEAPQGRDNVFGFIDGTLRQICRPSDGLGGLDNLQRECYSGHKRTHGLKFQSVALPNGLVLDLYGPVAGSHHDAFLLNRSAINDRVRAAQLGQARQFVIYGDAAYPILSHVCRGARGAHITPADAAHNEQMSSARVAVEWCFGETCRDWAFVDFKKNQKLGLQQVGKYYAVAQILQNCRVCLYGSKVGTYFNLTAPTLEAYVATVL